MKIEGKFLVKKPIDKIWETMLDIDTITKCIPGVEGETKQIDEATFENTISYKVSFLKVKFKTKTTIVEKKRPNLLRFNTEGKDTMAGTTINVKSIVSLKDVAKEETEISYEADMRLVGKLATFGESIMRKKSKEIGQKIIENLQKEIDN